MDINSAFPSNYVKAADLQGKDATVTIENVAMEDIGSGEQKPVIYFQGKTKGLVLNKTNAMNISSIYGPDTDGWKGRSIVLYTAWVDFQGRSVQAIRVRPVPPTPQDQGAAAQAPTEQRGGFDEDAFA